MGACLSLCFPSEKTQQHHAQHEPPAQSAFTYAAAVAQTAAQAVADVIKTPAEASQPPPGAEGMRVIRNAYVFKMPDGDTFTCDYTDTNGEKQTVRVRVMAIDCPETKQNFGYAPFFTITHRVIFSLKLTCSSENRPLKLDNRWYCAQTLLCMCIQPIATVESSPMSLHRMDETTASTCYNRALLGITKRMTSARIWLISKSKQNKLASDCGPFHVLSNLGNTGAVNVRTTRTTTTEIKALSSLSFFNVDHSIFQLFHSFR